MALWLVLSVIMPNVMMPIIDSANVFFYKTDMIAWTCPHILIDTTYKNTVKTLWNSLYMLALEAVKLSFKLNHTLQDFLYTFPSLKQ